MLAQVEERLDAEGQLTSRSAPVVGALATIALTHAVLSLEAKDD